MPTRTASTMHHHNHTAPIPMLRWVFRREAKVLTCEVAARTGHFEVSVVPHWDVAAAVIEGFEATLPAVTRHAEIASRLRDDGWAVDRVPLGCAGECPESAHAA